MGVLKRFEQRLEGLVNGTFAKVFKSEVQPVEIAGALQRECDNNATIWNRERTVVPNDFIVELSAPDHERLAPYSGQLGEELASMVRDYAQQQRYSFMGPIKVHLEKADDLDTGLYRIRSRNLAGSHSQAPQGRRHAAAAPRGGYDYGAPGAGSPAAPAPGAPGAPAAPAAPGGYGDFGDFGGGQGDYGGYGRQAPPGPPGVQPAPGGRPAQQPPMPAGPPPGMQPPAGGQLRHWLEINGVRHQMAGPSLVLGRSTEADVRIDDPGVSRRHCEIRTFDGGAMVQDLGSTNGIVVDGQHTLRATLRDGSRVVVGSTTVLYRQAEG